MGNLQSLACVEHVSGTKPKFKVGDCVANTPEDEFRQPDILKILVVGQKRYQYVTYNYEDKEWNDLKDDGLFEQIERDYHKVKCPR